MRSFRMSLHDRQRMAGNKRDRYRRDPDYRLARINAARSARGAQPLASLAECYSTQRDPATRHRDDAGRFAPDVT